MPKTYVTFGQVHAHQCGNALLNKDSVAVIECTSALDGRDKAFELFGPKFCHTYYEEQFDPKIMEYFPRGLITVN